MGWKPGFHLAPWTELQARRHPYALVGRGRQIVAIVSLSDSADGPGQTEELGCWFLLLIGDYVGSFVLSITKVRRGTDEQQD